MKKRGTVLIMLAALLFMTNGIAQVQLGLQAGANFADVTNFPTPFIEEVSEIDIDVETSMKTGFMFGGMLFYSFSPILGLQFEPAFVQKGAKVDISATLEGVTLKAEGTVTANYIDIPVLLKASFGKGPVKPYLLAGASVAFRIGDTMLEIDEATINGQDVTSQIPSDEREQKVEVKSSDFILNFGGGVIIPLGQVNIFIEGQYNLGLTDVNDEPDDITEIKTIGIQIKAGVMFPLN
ncbi:MAG: PorT family protein [Bacteroidetes bacterium]|nr:PorT family protein [Bacteroidota bacterium]